MSTATQEKGKAGAGTGAPLPAKTGAQPPAGGAPTKVAQSIAEKSKAYTEIVEAKVHQFLQSGQLHLPEGYSAENAMKAAYLILQTVEDKDGNKALEVCTRESIANSLLDMVVQGLNPAKKQGYFIVYGKTLTFQRSYFGSMAVAQMVDPRIKDWGNEVVYKGDKFTYTIKNGKKVDVKHEQALENVDKAEIIAAYSIALDKDGNPLKTEIATFAEIKQAWRQSKMSPVLEGDKIKPGSVQDKFTAAMVLKTVINKNCKIIINSSSDNALLLERINRNEDLADAAAARADIVEHANAGEVLELTADAGAGAAGPEEGPAAEASSTASEGADTDTASSQAAPCVCEQFTAEKAKEWDCPLHGRYQGGKFTPPSSRKPSY